MRIPRLLYCLFFLGMLGVYPLPIAMADPDAQAYSSVAPTTLSIPRTQTDTNTPVQESTDRSSIVDSDMELPELEKKWKDPQDLTNKEELLLRMTLAAYTAGDTAKAREYAQHLLGNIDAAANWNRNNCIHIANIVLGKTALSEGDLAAAKQFLIAAAPTDGSPQLISFGPNMALAQDLLARGEKEVVIEYLRRCGEFWERDLTESWIRQINANKTPSLSTMLTTIPFLILRYDASPYTNSRTTESPVFRIDFPTRFLSLVDIYFSIPLLGLLLLVFIANVIHHRQNLLILPPLLYLYLLPVGVGFLFPDLSINLFRLNPYLFQHMLIACFGNLVIVWLLSGIWTRWRAIPALFTVIFLMAVGGMLSIVNYPSPYHLMAEVAAFTTAIIASFSFSRWYCLHRHSVTLFMTCLFCSGVLFMTPSWPVMWFLLPRMVMGISAVEALPMLPLHFLVALLDGIGIFLILAPFLFTILYVPLYRRRFDRLMGWDRSETP